MMIAKKCIWNQFNPFQLMPKKGTILSMQVQMSENKFFKTESFSMKHHTEDVAFEFALEENIW